MSESPQRARSAPRALAFVAWGAFALSLLPLSLLTLGAPAALDPQCRPDSPHRPLGEIALVVAVSWLVYAVPTAPALLLLRRKATSVAACAVASVLMAASAFVAFAELFLVSVGSMC